MTARKKPVTGPEDMTRGDWAVALGMLVAAIVFVAGVAWSAAGADSSIDYCKAVQAQGKCVLVRKGEYTVVQSGTQFYIVHVESGKVVYVEKVTPQ